MPKNRNVANPQDEQWGSRYDHNLSFEHLLCIICIYVQDNYSLFSLHEKLVDDRLNVFIYFYVNEFLHKEISKFLVV